MVASVSEHVWAAGLPSHETHEAADLPRLACQNLCGWISPAPGRGRKHLMKS